MSIQKYIRCIELSFGVVVVAAEAAAAAIVDG